MSSLTFRRATPEVQNAFADYQVALTSLLSTGVPAPMTPDAFAQVAAARLTNQGSTPNAGQP